MADREELLELLDHPSETLRVEYKSTLDLQSNEHRATLARHIAAIANHGGGYIVFGFNDDLSLREPPHRADDISRDLVSSIVKKYLEPAVECEVRHVRSTGGRVHAVVIVAGHGVSPICAKAGGPERDQKPIGIAKGVYYIRSVGPESAPISSASDWQALIRRCVLHDRSTILAALGAALGNDQPSSPKSEQILEAWHNATSAALATAVKAKSGELDALLRQRKQFSYYVNRADGLPLEHSVLREALDEMNNEVRDRVQSGWSMYYPFGNRSFLHWATDPQSSDGDDDFLQMNLATAEDTYGRDFWRISTRGKASLIREFWEDGDYNVSRGVPVGTAFDPHLYARDLAETVRHAQAFAARFEAATEVFFRVEIVGLSGRHPEAKGRYFSSTLPAQSDARTSTGRWPVAVLESDWPEIVSQMAAPVARLFNLESYFSARAIASQADQFRRL